MCLVPFFFVYVKSTMHRLPFESNAQNFLEDGVGLFLLLRVRWEQIKEMRDGEWRKLV